MPELIGAAMHKAKTVKNVHHGHVPADRQHIPSPRAGAMTTGGEPWTHPTSGEKLKRTRLGACRSGRLALKRCPQSGGVNLYWLANGSPPHASFDAALRNLITKHRPVAEAAECSQEVSALCRLPPGDYLLEERSAGGQVLFRLEYPPRPSPRWQIAVARKGSGVLKLR